MEKRLVDLEVRYSYLERAVVDLDGVVLELRAEIDALRLKLKQLEAQARSEPDEMPANDPPPHY